MQHPRESHETHEGVRRCFVLKKVGLDPHGQHLHHFILSTLGSSGVTGVRTGMRYDIEGISDEEMRQMTSTIFAEMPVNDVIIAEDLHETGTTTTLLIEPLPGQYDQATDSAQQCAELLIGRRPQMKIAQVVLIDGSITAAHLDLLKAYLINPTDSREAARTLPDALDDSVTLAQDIEPLQKFCEADAAAIQSLTARYKLSMTSADVRSLQAYFKDKGREPTPTELKVIDIYWSDHCRHTTFTTELTSLVMNGVDVRTHGAEIHTHPVASAVHRAMTAYLHDRTEVWGNEAHERPTSLMDLALLSMREARKAGRLEDIEDSEENNAASIIVPVTFEDGHTEEWLLQIKNETHNHPTEIEPIGGAATCLGGAIRDPLSGRSYVFYGMRISGSADPRQPLEETIQGKLPQRRITTGAAEGFSGYGNQIGIPTTHVREYYHPGFAAKRLEVGFVAGAAPRAQVYRERPEAGDKVIVIGGRTGRDGINGASGSSLEHNAETVETRGSEVQKGNPVEERKIQRLFRDPQVSQMIKRCNDFGAGGYAVAIGELADGIDIDLDRAPLKYEGLDGTEIAISESQERMAIVVSAEHAEEIMRKAAEENLEATIVATITPEAILRMQWRGKTICELDRSLLSGGWAKRTASVAATTPTHIPSVLTAEPRELKDRSLEEKWRLNLSRINVASQRGIHQRFDSTVGGNTILSPYGGMFQASQSEASVVRFPAPGATIAAVSSAGFDPELSEESPFHGAMYSVVDSVARIVAAGGDPTTVRLTLQNYFGKLTDPARWGQPFLAQLGAREAQKHLGTPAIGGKDSMSGTFTGKDGQRMDVPPTLVSFAATTMQAKNVIPSHFRTSGSTIVHLQVPQDDAGIPDWNTLKHMWSRVHALQQSETILSSHAVRTGGIAAAVSELCFGNGFGATIEAPERDEALFIPQYGSMVVELKEGIDPAVTFCDLPYTQLGHTMVHPAITIRQQDGSSSVLEISALQRMWEEPLHAVFQLEPEGTTVNEESTHRSHDIRSVRAADIAPVAKPRVSVLTFPGSNCELETAEAFRKAGGNPEIALFRNRTPQDIAHSIKYFADAIRDCEIVAFPGGFSAGDQPDGSAKFIANVLRNERVRDAIERHIDTQKLILGICNGFQALMKSCLIPHERVLVQEREDATLTNNTIGHFLSMHAMHRVSSVLSPWMAKFRSGETADFPIAHGEGRIIQAQPSVWKNGQVPFQYAGRDGVVRPLHFPDNPNGSEDAIAALTDETGRIFGMMAHPERALPGTSTNIPTERKGLKIFQGGISYFQ